jgi:predicted nuclease of predicted toxin-antitoxin system
VKLWIDECLSPTLVERANQRGYWATCNRDRELLGIQDEHLHEIAIEEEVVFATNNEADFAVLYPECRSAYGAAHPSADRQP